jgi:hypothetical protein
MASRNSVLGWIFRGAEGDAAWYQLSIKQRYLAEYLKAAVPKKVYDSMQGLDAAAQAAKITKQLGFWRKFNPLNAYREGIVGTGASPGVRWGVLNLFAGGTSLLEPTISQIRLAEWQAIREWFGAI